MKMKSRSLKLPKFVTSPFNYLSLYRFASKWEYFLLFVGCVFTIIKALIFPFIAITFAEITSLLVERTYRIGTNTPTRYLKWFDGGKVLTNATAEENDAEIINDSIAYLNVTVFISIIQLVSEIISLSCFNYTANSQATRIRIKYFTSLMRQEMGWYDLEKSKSNFTVRLDEGIDRIKAGIGEQFSHFMSTTLTTVVCVFTAFMFGWKLTLIVITYLPIVFTLHYVIAKFRMVLSIKELNAYATAANIAAEVLSGIRTVFAFSGENIEIERYRQHLLPAQKAVEAKAICTCIEDATISFLYFFSCATAFWFGVNWVLDDRDKIDKTYTTSVLITIFINLTVAAESMVKLPPITAILTSAYASAKDIFAVIDHTSKLDPLRGSGKIIDTMKIKGDIIFKDVSFSYPSRPGAQILNGLYLKIKAGQTVALVGPTGNGKSTCLHLLQRFYDPKRGDISIDGYDIRSLNINSLRSCIACVGQEPVLFSTSIAENIRYGRPNATDREIIAAARSSGAHEFIVQLPHSYNTMVGENGSQFSCGEKQRIVIARALVQDPKILLLDEATAALDYHSEKYVQDPLDRASKGRTTIVVSHRMSAIKKADRIVFIHQGQIVEDGTHDELIALNGYYYEMVKSTCHELEAESRIDNNVCQTLDQRSSHQKMGFGFFKQKFSKEINAAEEDGVEAEDSVAFWESFKRIQRLIKSDWITLTVAISSSMVLGFTSVLFSVIFAEIYAILSIRDKDEAIEKLTRYCLICVGIGVLAFITTILQTTFFTKLGTKLTHRLRMMTFASILRQECGWFDRKENAVGILTSHLSGDAENVQNAIGFPISIILQSTTAAALGIIIAFCISLKLSIICAIPVIMIIAIVLMEERSHSKSVMAEKNAAACGMKIAAEAITNIRTVASLRQEKGVILRFSEEIDKVRKIAKKSIFWRSLLSSMNQMLSTAAYGFALCYGGVMVANHEIYYKDVIRIGELLLYGVMTMGHTLVFAPTIAMAFISAYRLFKIIDRNPLIGSPRITRKSQAIDQRDDVSFKRVDFRYATRPDVQVLNGLNLRVSQGQTVALVGPSGSGKTTCIQLLQRFYDPEDGRVIIGDDEISRDITLKDLRSKLSIVSQDPNLFDRTIAENIAYGDNDRNVTMNEIIAAAKTANAHNFIVKLPLGYSTKAGRRATQLSGGQKQKIAIARALIRNPKILLLDEATSALDSHSEKVVQQALATARTCIIIAHRLNTIKNADVICVVKNGKIVESGTHSELMATNGIYTKLYQSQK